MVKFCADFMFGLAFGLGLVVCLFVAKLISTMFSQAHFPL